MFRLPRFEVSMWNCNASLISGAPTTTNPVEAWHNAFRKHVGSDHVDIWQFIGALKQNELLSKQRTLAESAGIPYPTSSKDVIKKHERMNTLLSRYQEASITLLQLLQGLSRNCFY